MDAPVLRRHGHRLPKDARTLLQTPTSVQSVFKCGGRYSYFGLESGILKILSQNKCLLGDNSLKLSFNIDGVPLFKSTSIQFWPILCSFHTFEPFIVALFCGSAKPNPVDHYLSDFICELQQLCENGITHDNANYRVSVEAFICDAPARAFLKCIKGHTGYNSCERCTIHGSWNGRVVFNSDEVFPPRIQHDFAAMKYGMHQVKMSPLLGLDISCISRFPLDYMHMVCLGVVKRMLCFLRRGPNNCRLSVRQKADVSNRLESLSGFMPREFARQPRSLSEMDRWKATEFRQFLLYTGPVVLRHVVTEAVYDHFLSLTVSLSIMLDSDPVKRNGYLPYARQLIEYFVHKCKDIYGHTFTVYNVHNLLHLHEDVSFFQCSLNEVSAFQFENHLQVVKKLVRKSQNPIVQVAKRLTEIERSKCRSLDKGGVTFISTNRKDGCFLLHTEEFAFIREKRQDGKLVCDCIGQQHR